MLVNIKNRRIKLQFLRHKFYLSTTILLGIFLILLARHASANDINYQPVSRNAKLESLSLNKAVSQANILKKSQNTSSYESGSEEIAKKATELEGVFLSVMMEPMFPEGKESNLYGGGHGNTIFHSMMVQEYGKIFAESGGIGLADGIEKQFKKQR